MRTIMKPGVPAASTTKGTPSEFRPRDDANVVKIVDEVDRFFQSIHAEIEDWKFSMEDFGDGTRLFVRFQLRINASEGPAIPGGANPYEPRAGEVPRRVGQEPAQPQDARGRDADHTSANESDQPEPASGADPDLASFVELWRRRRDARLRGEFHKDGAPYADRGPETKRRTRRGAVASAK